jgi:hypothetical protein
MKRAELMVVSAISVMAVLACNAQSSPAADYQDAKHNVCEGIFSFPPCTEWGAHVTGSNNVALGDEMMPSLTGGNDNVALNTNALRNDTTGEANIAIGRSALGENTEGDENVALGLRALDHNIGGFGNVATGTFALYFNDGADNVASGFEALFENTSGSWNIASGAEALRSNTTGSSNVALGYFAGKNLTTGSHNIDVSNEGVAGEEGTTRVGTEGKQTRAFMAGIYPTPVAGCTVQVTSEGELGCNSAAGASGATGPTGPTGPSGPAGEKGEKGATGPAGNAAIATFTSFAGVASGNCLDYTELASQGNGKCPAQTNGWSNSNLLAGPTPNNGGTPTNLYVDTNATVKGSDTATVAVVDNTSDASLIYCTVNSSNVNHCFATSGTGSVGPGDNIEVKVTASGSSGDKASWRVRFRY